MVALATVEKIMAWATMGFIAKKRDSSSVFANVASFGAVSNPIDADGQRVTLSAHEIFLTPHNP
ncbi:MAG: hypothetical protein EOO68_21445 [Moraxellaceae bacterium]|nr:MAG: hypothetical protein EOO68_21445 [Moraxellaceae bacterium]